MNFQELLSKMQELDQPAPTVKVAEAPVEECGEMPPAPMGMEHKDTPPPSMSVNLNAQGLDDIAELMKLMTKVNPDMINQPEPAEKMPGLSAPGPTISLGNLDSGPLKMLPLDTDDEKHGDGPKTIDVDIDDKEEKEDEAFGNSMAGSEPEVKDVSAAIPDGNDLHKPKQMVKHSYKQGDNPMAMPENDLRAAIRAELLQRLAEAKGAK